MDFLFQNPPQPLQFWPADLAPVPANFVKPQNFREKHFGQWCRNLTMNRHIQCPKGSPFHWYICCGDDGTECCFGIQSWVYVIFGSLTLIFFIAFLFWLYLGPTNYGSGGANANANAKVVDTVPSKEFHHQHGAHMARQQRQSSAAAAANRALKKEEHDQNSTSIINNGASGITVLAACLPTVTVVTGDDDSASLSSPEGTLLTDGSPSPNSA